MRPVDREHERIIENGAVEPVRHDHLEAERVPTRIAPLLPFVDPGEAMQPPLGGLADPCRNRRRLQTIETGLQIVPRTLVPRLTKLRIS
jgi:hypothetical protein